MEAVQKLGYPVPLIYSAQGTDLVMEFLDGPTLGDAMLAGELPIEQGAAILADLHDRLHRTEYIHLDLHPFNVMLTGKGPVVIDWRNARKGSGDLDVADTALVLGMVARDEAHPAAQLASALLETFLRKVSGDPAAAVDDALKRRLTDPNLTEAELGHMSQVAERIKAARVRLRDVRDDDLEAFFEHQREPQGVEMAAFPARDRDAFYAHWAKIRADPKVIMRAIDAGGEVAGNIGCWEQSGEHLVGYWVGSHFWGRGIASKALALLVRELPIRPLLAFVAITNIGSIRVLEKCGFERNGEPTVAEDGVEEVEMVLRA
jgi:RimJ/RimL family protein N-acetyltransferase